MKRIGIGVLATEGIVADLILLDVFNDPEYSFTFFNRITIFSRCTCFILGLCLFVHFELSF